LFDACCVIVFSISSDGCPVPLDFALIVDASGSISRTNFGILIKFLQELMDGFDISEDGTHIAIVEYSTKPTVQLKFNDFSGAALNAANLKRKIDQIPHSRGRTYIDKALAMANRDVFSVEGGMRPDVLKVRKITCSALCVNAILSVHSSLYLEIYALYACAHSSVVHTKANCSLVTRSASQAPFVENFSFL